VSQTPADVGRITGARVAAYEQAAGATDEIDIESMIDFAAARPRSRARDLEIKALMARLAEFDPARAVEFAQSAYLDMPLLVQAFEALARADSGAAIIELSGIAPAARQRRIALALLEVIGHDDASVARVAAALPVADEGSFRIDALIARAETDLYGAMQAIFGSNRTSVMSLAVSRIAEIAARNDPEGALALSETIEDRDMRRSFQLTLLNAWGETDPDRVFALLETADPSLLASGSTVFRTIARSDPDRLLAMIDQFPPSARNNARSAVMQALAERDPVEAIAMFETMSPGQDRENMAQVIAQAYGRENPDLALAWVRSLDPPSQNAMRAVLQGIAQTDVDRAIDLMIEEIDNQGAGQFGATNSLAASLSFSMMFSTLSSNSSDMARLADRFLEVDSGPLGLNMSTIVSMWASRDSEAALNWTLANADRLDPSALRNVSQRMADENLDLAVSMLNQLPADKRAGWIEGLVGRMAQNDVNAAIGFVERYRGQPGYAEAYGTVIREIAQLDPVRAAGMLASAPESSANMSAIFTITREWANRDPAAAARWAMNEISDTRLQTSAISNVASMWAQRDGESAQSWIYSLSSGPARDAAINGYLGAAAQVGQFEPRLLEAYSSDAAGQSGVSSAIVAMARSDPEEARRLLDTYITDPAIRAQTAERLEQSTAVSSGIIFSNGNLIFLQ
jgi:hypothetical protein